MSKGDRVYGGERWTRGYWSGAELIDTHSSAPPTWKAHCFFRRGLCSSTETVIARAVSGSLLLIKRFADL